MRNNKIAINNAYYFWLKDLVCDRDHKEYNLLLEALQSKSFEWTVPNDDNRAFEGKNLRDTFCEEEDIEYDDDNFDDEASMFEVILGLAFRCDSIMADNVENISISEWFWRLMSNVELDKFTDNTWSNSNIRFVVGTKLDNIIYRNYQRNGYGGLFPLQKSRKDQRKVELWYQMCQYLIDNFYVDL